NPKSQIFDTQLNTTSYNFKNGNLVGGADIDCIFEYKNHLVLTDIKTTENRLGRQELRQIIGYALLYNERFDNFKFTDIGIYHSRSGSFRFLPVNEVIKKTMNSFESIDKARETFIKEVDRI
ncbi:MAG TPA: hypothetical protein VKA34_15750, partial [Balneolales bacterium]|nr:hypothetical protein [Balneolales bacterium]